MLVGRFALASVTISLLLNQPPTFCNDSMAKATNTTSRDLLSPGMVDEAPKPAGLVVPSIALVAATMTRVRVVRVPWMIQTLPV